MHYCIPPPSEPLDIYTSFLQLLASHHYTRLTITAIDLHELAYRTIRILPTVIHGHPSSLTSTISIYLFIYFPMQMSALLSGSGSTSKTRSGAEIQSIPSSSMNGYISLIPSLMLRKIYKTKENRRNSADTPVLPGLQQEWQTASGYARAKIAHTLKATHPLPTTFKLTVVAPR
jgi:hypothetical protein